MVSPDSRVETVEFTTNVFNEPRQITVSDAYDANVDVVLFDGDCSELLKSIPSNSKVCFFGVQIRNLIKNNSLSVERT